MSAIEERIRSLVAELTLDEKVVLVSGASFWSTAPIERIGLRAMILSDGPSGVRGPVWDERRPSASLPSGSALAASWDPALAYRYGAVAAGEARRKDVDVVLGPTINLHRSPLGGRHFEAFSEDPLLSGVLAASYVRGLQDNGVAATPKHYVANDSETDRFTVDVRLSESALRELYLLPFELAVEAGPWALMAAYNSIGGVTMTENALLSDPLSTEWGFDGVVVSDWTAVRSLEAARADTDLAMPGPSPAWSESLTRAVIDGTVSSDAVDRKVHRLLRLAHRVGALAGSDPVFPIEIDVSAFAREAAVEGAVLLTNNDELPWDGSAISTIAVIGHHARSPRTQGGGSATVVPAYSTTPLESVRAGLPHAAVSYSQGAVVSEGVEAFPLDRLSNPYTGEAGLRVTFLDDEGAEIFSEDRFSSSLVWFDGDVPLGRAKTIVVETTLMPEADGQAAIGFASSRSGRIYVDGVLELEAHVEVDGDDVGIGLLSPPSATTLIMNRGGIERVIRGEFDVLPDDPLPGAASVTLGSAPLPQSADVLIAEAVANARAADVALVVVGTNEKVESEGFDRTSLSLPGHQDALVHAVARANPRTVVVVNAGSPVLMPWRDEVSAVLLGYFGGQEMGAAIADILLGVSEPGGRLPTTWPANEVDVPVLDVVPVDGTLAYDEGVHIGYRAWLAAGRHPAFPFGWGLGYTEWSFRSSRLEGSIADDDLAVVVDVENVGRRSGKLVVQVYAERSEEDPDGPVRWLVGSAIAREASGFYGPVRVPVRARSLSRWDAGLSTWVARSGPLTLRIGSSSVDLPITVKLERVSIS
ncbi:beta-glucosidase [Labedella phragmitis]|uniref:Beta-glucosidase n=1 Tax=Labedella phragmitis TaxID=2498849 RepID=A0A3S5CEF2_9MICO|nr:glycoside hydrolase family 3 C-terminal domain-containing protein [Labedella phragmitis]RWZ50818.1 beta-glucosidase [Labedella phragmitis]